MAVFYQRGADDGFAAAFAVVFVGGPCDAAFQQL
jgi:hypothetical protein